MIYDRMPKKKSEYGKGTQTAVSFAGGYLGTFVIGVIMLDLVVDLH